MRYGWHLVVVGIFLGLSFGAAPLAAAETPVSFQSACRTQTAPDDPRNITASCSIGPIGALRVSHVTYQKHGSNQSPQDATFLPFDLANKPAAVLFVIDRSDKRRARTIGLAATDAVRMAEIGRGGGVNRFGLATLNGDRLDVLAPIGSSRDEIARAVSSVRADGLGADDTRGLLDAIRLLQQVPADRRILVVSSDGKPEDKAFATPEIASAARAAGIVVIATGYRERSTDGPELASLRKLAEDTGGFYAEPQLPSTRLDDAAITKFGQFLVSGGIASFPLDRADPRGLYTITVDIDGAKPIVGTYNAEITMPGKAAAPVKPSAATALQVTSTDAPGPKPAVNTPPIVQPVVAAGPKAPEPVEPGSAEAYMNAAGGYVSDIWSARPVTIVMTILIFIVAVGGYAAYRIQRASRTRVIAWLDLIEPRGTKLAVLGPSVRIGRHSDNDIRFRDKSVHRYHAMLQRDPASGRFAITDVSRTQPQSNGVMVNGEYIHQPVVLGNGDTVALGDISFRFVYA
jgi:hypothetical protein